MQRKTGLACLPLSLAVLCTAFIAILLLPGALYAAGEYLVHSDEPGKTGAVVLLSGGGDERMNTAARLMNERFADLLLLTDTGAVMADGVLVRDYMRFELIDLGVSPAQIQSTYKEVSSTKEEAEAVGEFLLQHKINSCVIVTDPYHTRRTRTLFRSMLDQYGIEVRVVASDGHWYRPGTWFLSLKGWQTTFQEYVKLYAERFK